MELIKLFLLSCSLLVAYSKGDDSTTVTVTENQDQLDQTTISSRSDHNYGLVRRVNKLTNNLRQCFCFLQKPTGVPVIQRLNPNGEKLERLVLYVYRDESSDDFKMYLPNYEKQLMIPDLAFDKGDILETWSSDEIRSIFDKYPYIKTNRDHVDFPDIAQIIDPVILNQNVKGPATFDENAVSPSEQQFNPYPLSPITLEENQINPVGYDDGNEYDSDSTMNREPQLLPEGIEYNTEKSNPDQGIDVPQDPNEIIEDTDLQDKSMKIVQINQNFDLNPKPIANKITKDNAAYPNTDNSNYNININLGISNVDEETERPSKIEVTPQTYPHGIKPHVEVASPKPVIDRDYLSWANLPNPNINNIQINPMPINPLIWNTVKPQYVPTHTNIKKIINYVPERKIINTIPIERPKIWYQNLYDPSDRKIVTLHPHRLIQKYQQKPIDGHDIYTFDNWLVHELERVQFADSEAANSLDIYTLKNLIEETLRRSGFFIGQNGVLVDSNGVQIHMANLVLRPILIGNSVEYKKLLKGKVSTFKLPTDLPYLEAVLVTSIKPQKILGIIPFGKTYLPKDYRSPLSLYVQNAPQGGCNKCSGNGIQSGQLYQTNFIPSRVEGFYNQYPSRWITTNYRPYIKKQSYGVKKNGQITPTPYSAPIQRDGQIEGTRRVFPFDQINTFIDKLYKVPLSIDKVKYLDRSYVVQPAVTTETVPVLPVVKYPTSVVTPGFRIIGGNAATSSGTPVSSKGRSGDEPEEVKTTEE